MTDPAATTIWARAFIDELARGGVNEVCMAPGSRSTPLVMAAARDDRLRVHVLLDERCAGFFALGLGKATGRPAAVVTTSGTAAANLLPAVVEANHAEVPLLLLTADRPPHLRDSDAHQATDQVGLYGRHALDFFDVAPPSLDAAALRHLRTLASRAVATATGAPAGPVHLNFPFRKPLEPLAPRAETAQHLSQESRLGYAGREGKRPFVRVSRVQYGLTSEVLTELSEAVGAARRGVVVAGPTNAPERLGEATLRFSAATGFPVLADPLSGARFRPSLGATVVGGYDLALASPDLRDHLEPDLVLRVGWSATSANLLNWLADMDAATHIVVDGGVRWKDHLAVADTYVRADPALVLERLAERFVGGPREGGEAEWRQRWERVERETWRVVGEALDAPFFEGHVLAAVAAEMPEHATLFVASSMPVRDLDAFGAPRARRLEVLGNRGVNGIDGLVSSALGVAAARAGPVVAVLGDIAFLHDAGGLLATREPGADVIFLVVHNDGGGIFHRLPIREHEPEFTTYFAAPHGLDLAHHAELHSLPFVRVRDYKGVCEALREALSAGGSRMIEVVSDRDENRRLHLAAEAAVREALSKQRP